VGNILPFIWALPVWFWPLLGSWLSRWGLAVRRVGLSERCVMPCTPSLLNYPGIPVRDKVIVIVIVEPHPFRAGVAPLCCFKCSLTPVLLDP
jgi:hypothetical protein